MTNNTAGADSEPVVHVCEHCLYPYGWFRKCESPPQKRVLTFRPPYPCPRCGFLQEKTQGRLRRRMQRRYYAWLILFAVLVLLPTIAASGLSFGWGIRPFGPIAIGGAILLVGVGLWSGFYRWALSIDPNWNLENRRTRAAAAEESPHVLSLQDLSKIRRSSDPLPTPPPWSWEEAEKRYRPSGREKTLLGSVFRGFTYGVIPALICLISAKFYLEITRAEWELSNLMNGAQTERTRAIDYLWNHHDPEQKELVLEWFATTRMSSQEADIYLIHMKPLRASQFPKVLGGILNMQHGVPGPQAWQILHEQPGLVAQRILQNLDKAIGDPARNLAILAKLDPQVLADTFEKEIVVKPELVGKLGGYGALLDEHWPVIARGVLRSSEGNPRLRLQLIESLLRAAPEGSLDDLLRESLATLENWVIEPVANSPREYLRTALFAPRAEWVDAIFEGIASVTEDSVPLSIKAADALSSLGSEPTAKALDPLYASADAFRWLKLRLLARTNPPAAAAECEKALDQFLGRDWGTLNPETLAEQSRMKADLADMARVLKGIPLDREWVDRCRKGFAIQDPEVRQEWVLLFSAADPEDLLRSFGSSSGEARQYRQWEVDALVGAIAENADVTVKEIADLLSRSAGDVELHLSPVVKYALLDYLGKVGDPDIIPALSILLDDEAVVHRSTGDARGASETVRIGDFAADTIRRIEESDQESSDSLTRQ